MKRKLITATLFIASIVGAFLLGKYTNTQTETIHKQSEMEMQNKNIYPLTTTVYEVDKENNTVTVEDYNGFLWCFEGSEDWAVGDCCSLIMDKNGTENIYDDKILAIRYSAFYIKR